MAHQSEPELLTLLGLRLKGFAEADSVADISGLAVDITEDALKTAESEGLAQYHDGGQVTGWALTAEGRTVGQRMLAAELDATGSRETVEAAYGRFGELNQTMLTLCTDWQVKTVGAEQTLNDHSDEEYDQGVIGRLVTFNDEVRPLLADLRDDLARYGGYGDRFREALEKLLAGDLDYFTKPIMPSYHTIWFELHEDLLATLGIERAEEGST